MKKLKMILEIIVIPMCITYLLYLLCNSVSVMTNIIFIVFTGITALEIIIKGIKFIYSYGPKVFNKILAGLLIINNVLLLFSIYWVNYQTAGIYMNYMFYITLSICLLYLLIKSIICIIFIYKDKGRLYTNVSTSFMYLVSLFVICMTVVLTYING